MDSKPYLRIYSGTKGSKYLTIAVHMGKDLKIIKSFGNANNAENWDKAIEFLLEELRVWYRKERDRYTSR